MRQQSSPLQSDAPSPLRQRLMELEHQLAVERDHHNQSRRQLEQAQRVLVEQKARAQRLALDHTDQLTAERQATMRAQRELDELLFERDQHKGAKVPSALAQGVETGPQAATVLNQAVVRPKAATLSKPLVQAAPAATSVNVSARKSRGRLPKQVEPAPKPVRWWTASYRAQARGKR